MLTRWLEPLTLRFDQVDAIRPPLFPRFTLCDLLRKSLVNTAERDAKRNREVAASVGYSRYRAVFRSCAKSRLRTGQVLENISVLRRAMHTRRVAHGVLR